MSTHALGILIRVLYLCVKPSEYFKDFFSRLMIRGAGLSSVPERAEGGLVVSLLLTVFTGTVHLAVMRHLPQEPLCH